MNGNQVQKNQKLLHEMSQVLTSTMEPREILAALLKTAVKIMKATSGSILLIEPRTHILRLEVAQNISQRKIRSLGLRVGQGVTGWVAKEGKPRLVSDVVREPKYVQVDKKIRSELAVPLILKGKVIGVINVDSTRISAFSPSDLELLSNIAAHSAQIIHNARLYSEVKQEADKLSSLFTIGQKMISSMSLEDVLDRVTEEAAKLTQTKLCSLMLLNAKAEELTLRSVYGGSEKYIRKPNLPVRQSLLGQVVLKKQPLEVLDVTRSAAYRHPEVAKEEGLVSLLSVPMIFQEKVIGILNVYSGELRHFSREEVDVLSALSSLSAMAIENTRLYSGLMNAEEFLRQQEKLAILGELAAEIAHEIRNPLTVMKVLIQSIQGQREVMLQGHLKRDLEVMVDKIRQMENIVSQVLTIGRSSEVTLVPGDILECLNETLVFMRFRLAQQKVSLETQLEKNIPQVEFDKGLMGQVFLNIILNAIQAMSAGGELSIWVKRVECDIQIIFKDSGIGISSENLDKLFQPFFTTTQGGTGLGLAIVKRIVDSHSGSIYAQSEIGKGSSFTIKLPLMHHGA